MFMLDGILAILTCFAVIKILRGRRGLNGAKDIELLLIYKNIRNY